MIRIIVTGANGQLGSGIRKCSSDYPDFQFFYSDLPEIDITDKTEVEKFSSEIMPSYIINCAAYTAVDNAEHEKEAAYMVNAEAVKILEEICLKDGVRLIHISTDYVFNGLYHKPYHEDDIPDPVSVYGLSKLKGESYLKNKGNAMVIRTSWLYSAHGTSFVSKILARASQLNNLRVVNDQIGSPTYAEDLAGAILEIISKSKNNNPGFIPGIYHYTNEGVASWFDFAIEILNFFGSGCPVIPVESHEFSTPAPRPFYSVLSKQKIRDTYGLNIPYWKDSLKLCMDEIKITNKI